jgi:hypothetical protein
MSPFLAGLRWRPDRVRRSSHLRACCVRPASISRCTRNPLADADVIFPEADMYVISMNPCSRPEPRLRPRRGPCAGPGACRAGAWFAASRSARAHRGASPGSAQSRDSPAVSRQLCCFRARYVQTDTAQPGSRSGRLPLGPSPPGRFCPAGPGRLVLLGRLGRPGRAVSARAAQPGPTVLQALTSRWTPPCPGWPATQSGSWCRI